MAVATKNDPFNEPRPISDDIVRLREWGTDRVYPIPPNDFGILGTADECEVRLVDRTERTSRRHAQLERTDGYWTIWDIGSRNGTRLDGARLDKTPQVLLPGMEIGIGGLTLIAESTRVIAIRGFLSRALGWTSAQTISVDQALRSVRLAASYRMGLALSGDCDLAAIAHSLHVRVFGRDQPFIMCDPRRRTAPESVRSVANHTDGMAALEAARGGTLCVRGGRLPREFGAMLAALRHPDTRAMLIVCSDKRENAEGVLAAPIDIPPLATRSSELTRIVDEYALDAREELQATRAEKADGDRAETLFSKPDRDWVLKNASSSLSEIEKGTLRVIAMRMCSSLDRAASLLGMANVSLARWFKYRGPLPDLPQ